MRNFLLAAVLAVCPALASITTAQAATLKIGDPAPKLQASQWVQGDPVAGFDSNHVYIVEFWATWCGPCRASIPHLNGWWQKYKDKGVVVIGQDVWEQDDTAVAPFVKKMGDQMTYRVALDDKSTDPTGAMATTWMKAAGQDGIPTAFIVNQQGRIAWIGHPMELEAKLLDDILAGRYDVTQAATEYNQRQQKQQKLMNLSQQLTTAMRQQDWDAAENTVAQLQQVLPAESQAGLSVVRFQILIGRKNYAEAYKLAALLSETYPENARLQNSLAWFIATQPGLEQRDLALAEKAASRANHAMNEKEPGVLDTLARVQFMAGKTNEAVATQQKAVNLADGPAKATYQNELASYQQGKLPALPTGLQ